MLSLVCKPTTYWDTVWNVDGLGTHHKLLIRLAYDVILLPDSIVWYISFIIINIHLLLGMFWIIIVLYIWYCFLACSFHSHSFHLFIYSFVLLITHLFIQSEMIKLSRNILLVPIFIIQYRHYLLLVLEHSIEIEFLLEANS